MDEYIKREDVIKHLRGACIAKYPLSFSYGIFASADEISKLPNADVTEVVRCKDCKHFQPCFVLTDDGERRPYTEEEIKNGRIVKGDVGINCASRCERFGYWEENKIPVWYNENDFCSYGERKERDGKIY